MALDGIMAKMLAKDPDLRYQHVDELPADLKAIDLGSAIQTSRISTTTLGSSPPVPVLSPDDSSKSPQFSRTVVAAAVALLMGVCFGAAGFYFMRATPTPAERSVKRLAVNFAEEEQIAALDVTPDGSAIVYVTTEAGPIRVLDLNSGSVRTLDGTEGALVLRVSPDGDWVMMTMGSSVMRASLHGGRPISVVEATTEPGPYTAWAPGERLIYEDFGRLWIKPIVGGTPEQLTDQLDGEVDHDWPYVLPDGKTMVATIEKSSGPVGIGMWDLEKRERIGELEIGGYAPRWISTGHLVYELDGELLAVPFDLSERKITGVPVSLESYVNARTYGISAGGTFVSLQSASSNRLGSFSMSINRLDSDGKVTTLPFELQSYWDLSLSPDEERLAVEVGLQTVATEQDIWVLDLDNGFRERLTFDNSGDEPTWSPDGDSLMYVERTSPGGASRLVVRSADGRGGPRVAYSDSVRMEYPNWSPDGRYILFARAGSPISAVNRTSDLSPEGAVFTSLVLLDTVDGSLRTVEDGATRGRFSPDGRFITYEHRSRIFAKPVSLDGGVWDVSDGPGRDPQWSPRGGFVYFLNQRSLMRAEVSPGSGRTQFGNPETVRVLERQRISYDVASGERFVYTGLPVTEAVAEGGQQGSESPQHPQVNVVVNWLEHVRKLSPNR
jgi:Tol biopolymer transport system component